MPLTVSRLVKFTFANSSLIYKPKHLRVNHYPTLKHSASIMASLDHQCEEGTAYQPRAHVCSIIPPTILQHILNHSETSAPTRAAAQKTYNHVCKLQATRVNRELPHGVPPHGLRTSGIVPPQIFQAMRQSEDTSSEQKERAEHNLLYSQKIHSSRTGTDEGAASTKEHLYRALYDSQKTDEVNKKLLFEEGAENAKIATDQNASEVYDFFGKTYQFYFEVCLHLQKAGSFCLQQNT